MLLEQWGSIDFARIDEVLAALEDAAKLRARLARIVRAVKKIAGG